MIQNTFSFMQGIGEKTERRLWREGILTWDAFVRTGAIDWMGSEKKALYDMYCRQAREHLQAGDTAFFARQLKPREHWRLFEDFRDHAVALDIETNGYAAGAGGYVTVVGLYDGFDYKALVHNNGLTKKSLESELSRYKYLITFFGSAFDLPFLLQSLGVSYRGLHFDLCFGAKRAGIRGGLKKVEKLLGIPRDEAVAGFDGFDAVKLWAAASRGSAEALELLITYNRCDTVNLFEIADILYYMLRAQTGLATFYTRS